MRQNRSSLAVLAWAVTIALFIGPTPLLGFPDVPPPGPHFWTIEAPGNGTEIPETSNVSAQGDAAVASFGFIVYVKKADDTLLNSNSGTSTVNFSWQCTVAPPVGLGNKWGKGDAKVELWVSGAKKDTKTIKFI